MIKRFLFVVMGLVYFVIVPSQNLSRSYEFKHEMPVFLDSLKSELTYPWAWGNSSVTSFCEWRDSARKIIVDAMLAPPLPSDKYQVEILKQEQRNGYIVKKIRFNLTDYSRVVAYISIPQGAGPFPAIVLLHDHGGHYIIGKEKMIRPFDEEKFILEDADQWVEKCYDGQFLGDFFSSNGYITISIDALFWGERGRKEGIDGSKYADIAGNFMMLGRSLSAFMNYEDIYTVDFLSSLPEVDSTNIGCVGFSMGGYRSWMLAALSDKIKVGAAICWMNTTDCQFSWKYGKERGGFANMLPGVRRYLDYPHIASIACPKPMLFFNGKYDELFPLEGVQKAYQIMRQVWESQKEGDRLITKIWDLPHFFSKGMQSEVLFFFDEYLKK